MGRCRKRAGRLLENRVGMEVHLIAAMTQFDRAKHYKLSETGKSSVVDQAAREIISVAVSLPLFKRKLCILLILFSMLCRNH